MKKNKMLFTSLLLLLFATYSCEKEELQPETTPFSSEILKNVNPVFLEHDLSNYQIKPIWDSFITFDNVDAVEVNFTIDKKFYVPLSKNEKIRGRQRLLLTFEKGKVIETILEYIPSDSFMGNIKDINSGNFKAKQFNGEITFKHPNENHSIVWVLSKGVVIKKLKRTELISKQKKTHKTAELIEVCSLREIEYEICASSGEAESCVTHTRDVLDCVWIDYTDPEAPPEVDPYDCAVNPSWPWCQDGGGDGGDGVGGTNNSTKIEENINDDKLDPCSKGILDRLKNISQNDVAKIFEKLGGNSEIYTLTFDIGNTGGHLGSTFRGSYNCYTTMLDQNFLEGNDDSGINKPPTDIIIAAVMIHELVHPQFLSLFDDYHNSGNSCAYDNFDCLYQNYVTKNYINDPQHAQIWDSFINIMASALQEFNTGIAVPDGTQATGFYKDVMLGTLMGTQIFKDLYPEGSEGYNRILNIRQAEKNNVNYRDTKPQGKPCIP